MGAAADPAVEAEKDLLQFHRILARDVSRVLRLVGTTADLVRHGGELREVRVSPLLAEIAAALCLRQDDRRLRRGQKPASREGLLLVESRPSVESACC